MKNVMRIERVEKLSTTEQENWLCGWYRIAEDDGSTVAYCPDAATARLVIDGFEMRRYLVERCKTTCAGRERYSGRLRHEPDCPAYMLGLVD